MFLKKNLIKIYISVVLILVVVTLFSASTIYKAYQKDTYDFKSNSQDSEKIDCSDIKNVNSTLCINNIANNNKAEIELVVNSTEIKSSSNTGNKKAYLLMLTSEDDGKPDIYFASVSAIVYRLLHHPDIKTKLDDVDIVVMVTEVVSTWKINELINLGAIIKTVKPITVKGESGAQDRWKNCFTKLLMYYMTEYDTIVYMDADLLVLKNIDDLFSIAEKERERTQKKDFFGAVIDGSYAKYRKGEKDRKMFNAGLMILTPNIDVFNELISIAPYTNLYNVGFMEQGLLNYYYAADNKFGKERYKLSPKYNAQWFGSEQTKFIDEVSVIHQKITRREKARNPEVQQRIIEGIIEWIEYDQKKQNSK